MPPNVRPPPRRAGRRLALAATVLAACALMGVYAGLVALAAIIALALAANLALDAWLVWRLVP
jgi:hypothetical protein